MALIAGIDEAGRGSLFGPMVVAGVSVDSKMKKILLELGVRDSKELTPTRREILYTEILKVCSNAVSFIVWPDEIDGCNSLNLLEAVYMARIADELGCPTVYVDASDVDSRRFGLAIKKNAKRKFRVFSMHHADRDNVVVSAASIIAKVERDNQIKKLHARIGDFGSGYPSDPRTRIFMLDVLRKGIDLPYCYRKTWRTMSKLRKVAARI